MKSGWLNFHAFFSVIIFCLLLCSCGGATPTRYDPGAPAQPTGLVAIGGNGQVTLSWSAATNAAGYNVYYSSSPNVSKSTGNRIATVVGTSYLQTGLTNDTTYYFVVTSVNSNSEGAESNQVSATPALLGPYVQGDMTGTWNFNILVSGVGAGWMQGTLAVDNNGAVSFSSFLDSAGNTLPPSTLFPSLFLNSSGQVSDTNSGVQNFQGVMAENRTMIIGNSSQNSGSQSMSILQKQIPGILFSNAGDIQGFGGGSGGGARSFVYNQISSGSSHEWEFAAGQIGKDQKIQYTSVTAPSNPTIPGNKASILNITAAGFVTESLTGSSPQPPVVISGGFMTADKSVIVGIGTDTSGSIPKYILRIYQLVNIVLNDTNTFTQADLAGTYDMRKLMGGSSTLSASETLMIDTSGGVNFLSYFDSIGNVTLPANFNLTVDTSGNLTKVADTSYLGKLSYFKNMLVMTETDSLGVYGLSIALKR